MRLRLTCNAAGDVRLQCLRDAKHIGKVPPALVPLLDCSSVLQEMTTSVKSGPRPGFGSISDRNTFTRYGRTLVREAGAVLDNGPLSHLVFLTGTLPGSTEAAMSALAAWSGWVVQTLSQWIRDTAPEAQYLGVWEYQKRGALHVHVCIRVGSPVQATRLRCRWKARWLKILDAVEVRTGVDVYERQDGGSWRDSKWVVQADAQTVEKSVARYLSKYLSKGAGKLRRRCPEPPSRWWFCSRSLRVRVADMRQVVTVPDLSLAAVLDVFEKASSVAAEWAKTVSCYVCPYDFSIKGCIALLGGVQAGAVFRMVAPLLRAIGAGTSASVNDFYNVVERAQMVLGGSIIGWDPDDTPCVATG